MIIAYHRALNPDRIAAAVVVRDYRMSPTMRRGGLRRSIREALKRASSRCGAALARNLSPFSTRDEMLDSASRTVNVDDARTEEHANGSCKVKVPGLGHGAPLLLLCCIESKGDQRCGLMRRASTPRLRPHGYGNSFRMSRAGKSGTPESRTSKFTVRLQRAQLSPCNPREQMRL